MIALWLLACAGAPADTGDACASAPVVTWDNFGEGFTRASCEPCHASTSAERHGAPGQIVFDTEQDVAANAPLVLAYATGPAPLMPPAGGVTDDDRYLLKVWLTCYPPGR